MQGRQVEEQKNQRRRTQCTNEYAIITEALSHIIKDFLQY